jgi:hypothetical protein
MAEEEPVRGRVFGGAERGQGDEDDGGEEKREAEMRRWGDAEMGRCGDAEMRRCMGGSWRGGVGLAKGDGGWEGKSIGVG